MDEARRGIVKTMKYFYSDPHWAHENIIRLAGRPFQTIREMDDTLIANYNAVVRENDEVYILGDVGWKDTKRVCRILERLKGKNRFLIVGNHDHKNLKSEEFRSHFQWIKDYYEFWHNKRLWALFHYPIQSWNGVYRGSRHLFGHTHGRLQDETSLRMDVGVDNPICSFAPISIDKIDAIMNERWKNIKLEKRNF